MGSVEIIGSTKKSVVDGLVRSLRSSGNLLNYHMADVMHGGMDGEPVLWSVELTKIRGDELDHLITAHIIRVFPGGWGYKSITEMEGPMFYGVPLKWFDEYPALPSRRWSGDWRNKVREHCNEN